MIHEQILKPDHDCDCPIHNGVTAHIWRGQIISDDDWESQYKELALPIEAEHYFIDDYQDGMTPDELRKNSILSSAVNSGRADRYEEIFRGAPESCQALADLLAQSAPTNNPAVDILIEPAELRGTTDNKVMVSGKCSDYELAMVKDRTASWKAGAAHGAHIMKEIVTAGALDRDKELLGRLRAIHEYMTGIEGEVRDLTAFLGPEIEAVERDINHAEGGDNGSIDSEM